MRLTASAIVTTAALLFASVGRAEDKPADAKGDTVKAVDKTFDPEFEEAPLSDVLQWLQKEMGWEWNLSKAAQKACKRGTVNVRVVAKNVTGRQVLDIALSQLDLAWFEKEGGGIDILTGDEYVKDAVLVIHDTRDLLAPVVDFEGPEMETFDIQRKDGKTRPGGARPVDPEHPETEQGPSPIEDPHKLPELVRDGTGGDEAWVEGTSIDVLHGMLYVKAPRALQMKVRGFLNKLHQFK